MGIGIEPLRPEGKCQPIAQPGRDPSKFGRRGQPEFARAGGPGDARQQDIARRIKLDRLLAQRETNHVVPPRRSAPALGRCRRRFRANAGSGQPYQLLAIVPIGSGSLQKLTR